MTRILLADDHPFLRLGLSTLIAIENDMTLVGEAENGQEAVALTKKLKPDVVVMDLAMPVMSGLDAIAKIKNERPETRILVLTTFGTSSELIEAVHNGVSGIFLKDSAMVDFIDAIRTIANGGEHFSPDVKRLLDEEEESATLTPRQLAVLESAVRGLSDRDIATQFDMTLSGAKHHMRAIYAKLGAANRTEAVAIALRKHLLKI